MEQKNNSLRFMAITGWALSLILICAFIAQGAWVTPTANPPSENLSAPINVGSSNQTKLGALSLNGAFTSASTALFQGNTTFTPSADGTSIFKITNHAGTSMFNINSQAGSLSLQGSASGPALSLDDNSGSFGALDIASNVLSLTGVGAKLGIGVTPTTDNLEIIGSTNASGQVKSDTGFCIGASCITSWPEGGSSIPATTVVLSEFQSNANLQAAGFVPKTSLGMPLYINAQTQEYGPTTPFYLFEKF